MISRCGMTLCKKNDVDVVTVLVDSELSSEVGGIRAAG